VGCGGVGGGDCLCSYFIGCCGGSLGAAIAAQVHAGSAKLIAKRSELKHPALCLLARVKSASGRNLAVFKSIGYSLIG
jgi:hypothetical protein